MIFVAIIVTTQSNTFAAELEQTLTAPMVPIGIDSYLMWDRLPYHRIGIRAYMRSTYDRTGSNTSADASHYLYQQSDDFNVSLDVKGPGILYFKRTNHWHGSPWHYEVDSNDFIVKETATDEPDNAKRSWWYAMPEPFSQAEFEFEAEKDTEYAIWLRGKCVDNDDTSDAMWMQFDDAIGGIYMHAQYNHAACFGNWIRGYPNNVFGWSSAVPAEAPRTVTFKESGLHRLRIQPRKGPFVLDQIWLSPTQKTMPDSQSPVDFKDDPSQIVLNAKDALNMKGKVKVIDDKKAFASKALSIDATNGEITSVFLPENLFPNPLTWTWSTTKGADLMWVPIPFEDSFRMGYTRTHYGTGYYIYHLMTEGMKNLSRPIESWKKQAPDPKAVNLMKKAGTDIAPKGDGVTTHQDTIKVDPFKWTTVKELAGSPATIRAIKFTIPREDAYEFGQSRLRITWDHRWHASIDAPIALFFGAGHLYNNDNREYLVKGFPMVIRYDDENVYLSCYYPMPFFQHAKIELQSRNQKAFENVKYEIRTVPFNDPINTVSYFHATYRDIPTPKMGHDNTFLDTTEVEGGGDWSGSFVGMSWIFSHNGVLGTLEGDPRFFFDDSQTPQAWGTGTEEWGGGGDYWGGRTMTLPFAGHPVGSGKSQAENKKDMVNSAYRFLITDFFPFCKNAKINLEHGGANFSREHYEGVVYWYGIDSPAFVMTDTLNVCDEGDIKKHNYVSKTASKPYELTSRYELGRDSWHDSQMFQPPQEDKVRTMKGDSTFNVKLIEDNLGVMLRRKFDYSYPNQTAKVFVRPANSDKPWQYAGTWYTSGSNTCVYSNPAPELGKTQHKIVTSNRRWREEEFLISPSLTKGVKKLAVKIQWVPDNKELFPGKPFPKESAWTESRYWVYCYKMPKVTLANKQ